MRNFGRNLLKINLSLFLFFWVIIVDAQNDSLPLPSKGGKKLVPDSLQSVTLKDSLIPAMKGGKSGLSTPIAQNDSLPKDSLSLPRKKWEFPPTTDAAQRWEKKVYVRFLQELPKPISTILMPLDTNRQDPNVAYKRALLLPGWGQAYNRSYWKIPIVYAGLGGLGYWFYFNHQKYKTYQTAYRYSTDGDSTTNPATIPTIKVQNVKEGYRALRDSYRRTRDQSVIFVAAFYALQVIEAYTNAHLKYFEVEEDLSWQIAPTLMQTTASSLPKVGIGLNLRF